MFFISEKFFKCFCLKYMFKACGIFYKSKYNILNIQILSGIFYLLQLMFLQ